MNLRLTGRHMNVSESLKQHAGTCAEKLQSHVDHAIEVEVVLETQKLSRIAEVHVHGNGTHLHGKEEAHDMRLAVDRVFEKLEKQMDKQKAKRSPHARKPKLGVAASADSAEPGAGAAVAMARSVDPAEQPEAATVPVVKEQLPLRALSIDEAVRELNAAKDRFMMFANAATSKVSVVYARNDGSFAVIEPQF